MDAIANLEKLLATGKDSALLRFGLGNAYLKAGDPARAAEHLAVAVELDPDYSAAWKLYAKALSASGQRAQAIEAYARGIDVAQRKGDLQAAKEMTVFLRRLQRDVVT